MAQLVERLLLTPEIRNSNPNIGKIYRPIVNLSGKDKNKEKEAGKGPSLKKYYNPTLLSCPVIEILVSTKEGLLTVLRENDPAQITT